MIRGIAVMLLVSAVFWGMLMAACYALWGCNPLHLIPWTGTFAALDASALDHLTQAK